MQHNPERTHPVHLPVYLIDNRSAIIFVTVCSKNRETIFANSQCHKLLLESWEQADKFLVGRYSILPDHIHLFCCPSSYYPAASLKSWITFWKSMVSCAWPWKNQQPIWQRDFWDVQLRRGDSYNQKWEYVKENPTRHKLVTHSDEWPFQGKIHDLIWHDR